MTHTFHFGIYLYDDQTINKLLLCHTLGAFISFCHSEICISIDTHWTPLYKRDLRDVAIINSSRFKIKALSLRNCFTPFDPGSKELLGGQLRHSVRRMLFLWSLGRSDMYVCFKTAWRLSSPTNVILAHFHIQNALLLLFQYTHIWRRLKAGLRLSPFKFAWNTFEKADSRPEKGW